MVTRKRKGQHRQAVDAMVEALATGQEHGALIESCRSLAVLVDAVPAFDDKLWREYRLALKALMDRMPDAASSDDFDAEFDALRAEVGDTANT